MNRRDAATVVLALAIAVSPFIASAQPAAKLVRIGFLAPGSPGQGGASNQVIQRLNELGYVEGKNAVIERRFDDRMPERLPALAAELVLAKVDVIVAITNLCGFAAKEATRTIPIVVWGAHGALETGLVASLARPGGNITGVESLAPEVDMKRVQLLREIVPGLARVAALYDAGDQGSPAHLKYTRDAGRIMKVDVSTLEVRRPADFDPILASAIGKSLGSLLVYTSILTYESWPKIAAFAQQNRLPTMCEFKQMARAGCLVSYGPTFDEFNQRVARQVDRILRGSRPGDLPIEQPTKFELVINLKTARAIGLTIPPNVLLRADEVIE